MSPLALGLNSQHFPFFKTPNRTSVSRDRSWKKSDRNYDKVQKVCHHPHCLIWELVSFDDEINAEVHLCLCLCISILIFIIFIHNPFYSFVSIVIVITLLLHADDYLSLIIFAITIVTMIITHTVTTMLIIIIIIIIIIVIIMIIIIILRRSEKFQKISKLGGEKYS
jgi:hypothetical protein